jgi:hypothetical protein
LSFFTVSVYYHAVDVGSFGIIIAGSGIF